ncbi:hypothetical protein [Streptomyces cavernae]|uniref:hypothetical protein n=1 Tax=Streptomyces cavernae TaxID=2259034 RepID=UPI000FEBC7D9|nr:hypothetical protein [Streptomyces cavernae]
MSEQAELFPIPPTGSNTPARPLTSGGRAVRVKRACNGCGHTIGDATDAEIEACIAGTPLPDNRDQCPHCAS